MDLETTAHPEPILDHHHRKVELQSPHDLTYLQSNLIACARQKLDLHFPLLTAAQEKSQPATVIPLDGVQLNGSSQSRNTKAQDGNEVEDPLRVRVREVVEAFIARTWEGACKNITVNGLDATSLPVALTTANAANSTGDQQGEEKEDKEGVDFVYEPYDSQLQAKVAALYGELETLTAQVSKLRRIAPAQGAEMFAKRLMEEMETDNVEFERRVTAATTRVAEAREDVLQLKPQRDGWYDDVHAMYDRGTTELAMLAGVNRAEGDADHEVHGASLTETLGKIQRARTVAMEFE
ncbi:uncharacterized protein Z519_10259 [Cladophialophora bantiana CBS 173.52]|uniref:Uncharacterized protein n=1 Tax=Cladophialophora bantiana (strain ATCC 10958 / CBS 173.52 / CDC B-1940 / NIH 8579) TaxID=1442370 RepID=A0A0D2HF52_CLAB1|nr:uncharacterized protein Z519_10259 [Cladophialophora bantiana CBS 173.52]KIW89405.1 hypothetical protein Z519_10259 [Cladophialophora bantiana CBS 173.52]